MKQHQGFTLIEAMLALFILTIGILGVAGMQMEGMRSSNMALQRTIVSMKTQEIIERMRANSGVPSSNNHILILQAYAGGPVASSCSGIYCSNVAMAGHDLFVWNTELTRMLPTLLSATIVVNPPAVVGNPASVLVTTTWADRDENNLSYSVSVQI